MIVYSSELYDKILDRCPGCDTSSAWAVEGRGKGYAVTMACLACGQPYNVWPRMGLAQKIASQASRRVITWRH
jgi:hypothetical protein